MKLPPTRKDDLRSKQFSYALDPPSATTQRATRIECFRGLKPRDLHDDVEVARSPHALLLKKIAQGSKRAARKAKMHTIYSHLLIYLRKAWTGDAANLVFFFSFSSAARDFSSCSPSTDRKMWWFIFVGWAINICKS
jgi:hypothetical protein